MSAEVGRTDGSWLLALPCSPARAAAWTADADEVIAPLPGLPRRPVAELPGAPEEDHGDRLHGKTRALVEAAARRPFARVDDEITGLDRARVARHHPAAPRRPGHRPRRRRLRRAGEPAARPGRADAADMPPPRSHHEKYGRGGDRSRARVSPRTRPRPSGAGRCR
ncbi:hypothetical protein [Streptomyces sp. 604F]|uniref:hypothetical protein n=1 Tax=Streptomyces sp. 604F TaxID=1476754 RepID=UPI003FA6BCDA